MSYTLEDFRLLMSGESTHAITYAKSTWGVEAGEPVDVDQYSGLGYLVVDEDVPIDVAEVGHVEGVVDWGGEGDGAPTGRVVKVTNDDGVRYFEQTGTYSSWDSTYYGDWYEVEPFEKTVIRYRLVK